jgi:hypothetical protein
MDNDFNNILNIFKRLNEDVTASSISSPHGPGAVAGAQRGPFAGLYTQIGDKADKETLAAYQIRIMDKQVQLEIAKKLGGVPPKFGRDGTGIFSGMEARDFPKWLDAHPQYVDAILGITGTNNKTPAATIPPSQQVAQNQQSQTVNVPPVPTAGQTTMTDYKSTPEGTMSDAEQHASGARFGGYWKGTDKGTPRPGQGVGGTAESIEEQIVREYTQYLKEYGMTTGGMSGTGSTTNNPVDQVKMNKDIQQAQQNLNKIKSAGVPFSSGVGQAAKNTVATVNNPAVTATGQGMDQQSKKTAMGLGQEMEKLMATGNQSQVQQVANVIKQVKLGQK